MALSQEQQVQGVQQIMANVQVAYDNLARGRATLARLIQNGLATCQDIKVYNIQARAVWQYQDAVAKTIRAQGGQAPVIPAPIYVGWRGVAGDRFADVDCDAPQFAGAEAPGVGAAIVDPANVEWRQEVIPQDAATVAQLVDQAGRAAVSAGTQAGLGALPAVVPLIILGILVTVGLVIVLKVAEALMDIPGKREVTKQIAAQASAHDAVMQKRESCFTACVNTGKDRTVCARDCSRLYDTFKPQYPAAWGIVGKVIGVAAVGLLAYAGYRFIRGGGLDRVRAAIPGRDADDEGGVDVGGGMTVLPAHRAA